MSTQQEVAEHLTLSARRVRDLIKEGHLPGSKGPGGLSLDACRVAYIDYLRGLASGQVAKPRENLELDQERALLAIEQRRKLTRENDIAEGLVAPREHLTAAIAIVASQMMSNLEALPLNMKRANPLLTGHDIFTVKKCIARCCDAIRTMKLSDAD